MRAHAIPGPWAAGERVLVCVNEDPSCAAVMRYARRLADRLHAPWTALHVETHALPAARARAERDRIAEGLRLAERLGGEAVTIPGGRIAEGIVEYASANNFTHIVIGKSRRSRWSELVRGSVVHDLVRRAGDISVHVIAGDGERRGHDPGEDGADAPDATMRSTPRPYLGSLGIVAVALGVGHAF